jgi:hypothetical protein
MSRRSPQSETRPFATVSFAVSQEQLDQLRALAAERNVSLSHVAREAFDVALTRWTGIDAATAEMAQAEAAAAAGRTGRSPAFVRWPRAFRRQAAKTGGKDWDASR